MGFVPCRQAANIMRGMIDLIEVVNKQDDSALLFSLDAEKAFYRLNWPFTVCLKH